MDNTLYKNQIVSSAFVTGISSDGAGVCKINGRAVFVPGVIEGEEISLKIIKASKTAVFGKLIEVISPSQDRIPIDCTYFPKCGGCSLRYMSYEKELADKLKYVNNAFQRIGNLNYQVNEIIGSPNTEHYRNKAIYAVGTNASGEICGGFYRQKSHDIIEIDSCMLQSPDSVSSMKHVIAFCKQHHIEAYDEISGKGSLRHIFTRNSRNGKIQVCLVSARGFGEKTAALKDYLINNIPNLSSLILNINKAPGNVVFGDKFFTLWGSDDLSDLLCGYSFDISPAAFFQINPLSAENLYEKAAEFACGDKNKTALDLYCGAGTITLRLSKDFGKVIGAEIVPEAVNNAGINAEKNGVYNTKFICGDAAEAANRLVNDGVKPDVIVVDPPRKGMDRACIDAILKLSPQRIVYVSCNPATQARDLAILMENGYYINNACAVDMFPRTHHVETVVLLSMV